MLCLRNGEPVRQGAAAAGGERGLREKLAGSVKMEGLLLAGFRFIPLDSRPAEQRARWRGRWACGEQGRPASSKEIIDEV